MLRNLRNILEADVSGEHINKVCDLLSDENAVKNSKQFPFRFLSAYRMLGQRPSRGYYDNNDSNLSSPYLGNVLDALETAMVHSSQNIKGFDNDRVLIATDVSASMMSPVSSKSVITMYDIGSVLSMMMYRACKVSTCGIFGNKWMTMNFPKESILRNANDIWKIEGKVGYSTNGYKVLQWANNNNYHYDKIMMFTDCELYGGSIQNEWKIFKERNPKAKIYLFNLNGYGTSPLNIQSNDVYLISGWSDRIFDILNSLDKGKDVLNIINEIPL
jgi:hypothetical protein